MLHGAMLHVAETHPGVGCGHPGVPSLVERAYGQLCHLALFTRRKAIFSLSLKRIEKTISVSYHVRLFKKCSTAHPEGVCHGRAKNPIYTRFSKYLFVFENFIRFNSAFL